MKGIIKTTLAIVLALALLCGAALAENAGDAYVGKWIAGRIVLTIEPSGDGYSATVLWSGSAWETARWEYPDVTYDEVADELNTPETGVKENLVYNEDGEIASSETVFTDGAAAFRLDADGNLVWVDYKETPGENEIVLERAPDMIPAPEDYVERYFRPIGALEEGTAGASLKQAIAAADAFAFASEYELWNAGKEALRDNLLAGYDSLTDDEREAFDQHFMDVVHLLDDCLADWEANRALFDDAGVAEVMDAAMADDQARQSWERLRDNTFTMGNDSDVG